MTPHRRPAAFSTKGGLMTRFARILGPMVPGGGMLIVACALGCARPSITPAEPSIPPIVVEVRPDAPWTETSITVKRGEHLEFTATGTIFWQATGLAAGPDGKKGIPGWSVGAGGLIGTIAGTRIVGHDGLRRFRKKQRLHRSSPVATPVNLGRRPLTWGDELRSDVNFS